MSGVESAREQLLSSGMWSVDPASGNVLVGDAVQLLLDVAAVRV